MEKYGGSFVKALAECFHRADNDNFLKLQLAFHDYWQQYRKMTGFVYCTDCDGMGWTAEHDPSDTRDEHMIGGDCQTCHVQVQCDTCEATGMIKEKTV